MSPNPGQTPEATISLDLEGKGFSEAADQLTSFGDTWGKIEKTVGSISEHIGGWGGKLTTLLGLGGLGAVYSQFEKLEASAANTAGYMNQITGGPRGYTGLANVLAGVQARTGVGYGAQAAGLSSLNSLTGLGGLAFNQSAQQRLLMELATYSMAYGTTPSVAALIGGQLAASTGQGPQGAQRMLSLAATQSAQMGLQGQTAQMGQIAAGLAASSSGIHPYLSSLPGSQTSSLAGAFSNYLRGAGGPAWNQQAIAGAYGGFNAGLQSAPFNPSLQAFMAMNGISVQDEISGLAGPHAAGTLSKLIAGADRMYGKGSTLEELFLMSNFGPQAADAAQVFHAHGMSGLDALLNPTPAARARQRAQQGARNSQRGSAPDATRSKVEGQGLRGIAKIGQEVLNALGGYGPYEVLGGGLAARALGRRGLRALRGARGTAAKDALSQAAEDAATGGGDVAAAEGAGLGAGAAETVLSALAGVATGGVAAYGAAMLFPDSAGLPNLSGRGKTAADTRAEANAVRHVMLAARRRFGSRWTSAGAYRWMRGQLNDPHSQFYGLSRGTNGDTFDSPHPYAATQLLNHALGAMGVNATAQAPEDKFAQAVDKFSKALDRLAGPNPQGGRVGAAYSTGLGAPAIAQVNALAPGMILASMLGTGAPGTSSGPGSGPTTTLASFTTPAGSPASGSGWGPCTLTWYDPALGGINGGGNYASGGAYHASDMACAAPAQYAFGTVIEFSYQGTSIRCTVRDRGGAITGSHFDLTRGAAGALGMLSAGKVSAQFRVVSSASHSKHHGQAQGAPGSSSAAGAAGQGQATPPGGLHATMASAHSGGGDGGTPVHIAVHIDGRLIERHRRLVRGRV